MLRGHDAENLLRQTLQAKEAHHAETVVCKHQMKTETLKDLSIYFLAKNRKRFPVRLMAQVAKKIVNGCENYSYNFKLNGEEMVLAKLEKSNLTVFFDVGANRGEWSILVRRHFPASSVHCFEIAPPMHDILGKAVKQLSPPVIVNHFGLSNKTGPVKFNFCTEADGMSSLLLTPELVGQYVQIDADVVNGDDYVEKHAVQRIDFLKLDVEGAENLILTGLSETLKRGAIKVIQFEYGLANIIAEFLLKDFYQLLEPLGYSIGKIFPERVEFKAYSRIDENFIGPNFLAVRKDEKDLIKLLSS